MCSLIFWAERYPGFIGDSETFSYGCLAVIFSFLQPFFRRTFCFRLFCLFADLFLIRLFLTPVLHLRFGTETNALEDNIMRTRIITAVIAILAFIPVCYFSDTFIFTLFCCLISWLALYEMLGCIGTRKKWFLSIPVMIVGILMPFIARRIGNCDEVFKYIFFISFVMITWSFTCATFSKGRIPVDSAALTAATTIYISFGMSSIVLLRYMENGKYIYLLAFVLPWMSDTFAYFGGFLLGKHKLIPDVSPKKTVEGCIAGILGSGLTAVLYGVILAGALGVYPTYLELFIVGMIVSLLSQTGDLIASLIKRHFGIKDYGFILPGHGGILDRFDSILLAAPALYFVCELLPGINPFI